MELENDLSLQAMTVEHLVILKLSGCAMGDLEDAFAQDREPLTEEGKQGQETSSAAFAELLHRVGPGGMRIKLEGYAGEIWITPREQ